MATKKILKTTIVDHRTWTRGMNDKPSKVKVQFQLSEVELTELLDWSLAEELRGGSEAKKAAAGKLSEALLRGRDLFHKLG